MIKTHLQKKKGGELEESHEEVVMPTGELVFGSTLRMAKEAQGWGAPFPARR
jgi:hypothetical protein